MLLALRFLEEAGEQKRQELLHNHASLVNAAKEAALKKAKEAASTGSSGRKQAPPLLLAILAVLEDAVLDETLPRFHRAYAWYRLFRHWASMSFDDTVGMAPQLMERRARGVYGVLRRTKTSGPDKKTAVLSVFVSRDAWVRKKWLFVGFELCVSDKLCYERVYFLPLPEHREDTLTA